MTTSDATQETVERCVFATPTGERWCNCNIRCEVIICNNAERNANVASRSDGAAFHSAKPAEYNEVFRLRKSSPLPPLKPIAFPNGAAFVRSRFCRREHCVDFKAQEK